MKKIGILILGIMLTSPCFAQTHKTDLQKENLIGKVKSVVEVYKDKYDERKTEFKYNPAGNISSETIYYKNRFSGNTEYGYDAKGYLVSVKKKDSTGKILESETYVNDLKGNALQIKTNSYEPDGINWLKTYKRDTKGNVLEEVEKNSKTGIISSKTIYKYDAKGTVIFEHKTFSGSSYMKSTYTPIYNAKGLLEENREVSESDMSMDDLPSISSTAYLYNDNDILKYEASDFKNGRRMNSFDDKGNLVEEEENSGRGPEVTRYKYEFDASGNWTKKTCVKNNAVYSTNERVIAYY